MLSLLFAAAVSASSTTGCRLSLERGDTVIERRTLKVREGGELEAVAVSKSNEWKADPASRIVVLGPYCTVMFSQRFDDAKRVLFTTELLGKQPILFVTAYSPGGSDVGFEHALLAYGGQMFAEDGVQPLAPTVLTHGSMDGIFVGDLGRGRRPGLVMWNAQWADQEAHYSPHKYQIVTYRWRDGRFVGPNVRTTKRKYNPDDPDAVARHLGLTFHDMTQRKRFGWR